MVYEEFYGGFKAFQVQNDFKIGFLESKSFDHDFKIIGGDRKC